MKPEEVERVYAQLVAELHTVLPKLAWTRVPMGPEAPADATGYVGIGEGWSITVVRFPLADGYGYDGMMGKYPTFTRMRPALVEEVFAKAQAAAP